MKCMDAKAGHYQLTRLTVGAPDEGDSDVDDLDGDVHEGIQKYVEHGRDVQWEQAVAEQTNRLKE